MTALCGLKAKVLCHLILTVALRGMNIGTVLLSTLYIVFALRDLSKTDSDYIAVFFDTDRWHRGVAERAAEGARNHGLLNISANDFFDISISLPCNLVEQQKIGIALKRLDNLITLHQRQVEKLKNIKSALLEKMFV